MENREVLIEVNDLSKHFKIYKNEVHKAVDKVNFKIYKGETFGLVGQSGSGKSTTGKLIIRLLEPTSGDVFLEGKNITKKLSMHDKMEVSKKIQMIFQDPYASLNPRMTVMDIISEGMIYHNIGKDVRARKERVYELLETVGLNKEHANRYPHEFSGGQRQRIGIARALAVEPEVIIADEPISALDVSIQAQVVNLLEDLQKDFGLTFLFIAHDLSMVKHISDRVAVMENGRIVEIAQSSELYKNPVHPYTKSLLSAIPIPDPKIERQRKRVVYESKNYLKSDEELIWNEIGHEHWVLMTESELGKL